MFSPLARLDFPCRCGETNDRVKRNLTWQDPELREILPPISGIRMHFTFSINPPHYPLNSTPSTKPTPLSTELHALY